jgi:iron-sulfur cluster assembly protein
MEEYTEDILTENYYRIHSGIEGSEPEDDIFITPNALREILNIYSSNNIPDVFFLRINSESGGPKGLIFNMDFDFEFNDNDRILKIEEFDIVVDAKTLFYLLGTTIDYNNDNENPGFIVKEMFS